jgi:hypothetical protein
LLKGFHSDDRSRLLELVGRFGSVLDPSSTGTPVTTTETAEKNNSIHDQTSDPNENPHSPQFALRRMLQALSQDLGPQEKGAA